MSFPESTLNNGKSEANKLADRVATLAEEERNKILKLIAKNRYQRLAKKLGIDDSN